MIEGDFQAPNWLDLQRLHHNPFIYLPGIGQHGATHQMVPINPVDLDAALEKDQKNHAGFDHSSA